MAEKAASETKGKQKPGKLTFVCQECRKSWSITQMRRIVRFRPVLVVCPQCESHLR